MTYNGGILPAWSTDITMYAGWNTTMMDAFLNAFALVAPIVVAKTLDLRGTNQPPSAASATARATITGRGWTILTN